MLVTAFDDESLNGAMVFKWLSRFEVVRHSFEHDTRSECRSTDKTDENAEQIGKSY